MTAIAPTHAMVLAAGLGLRMRPLTETCPKPLVRLDGRPLIDHALDRLAAAGVTDAVVNLHHLGDQIRDHLAGRDDLRIAFSDEPERLETGGGVRKALPLLGTKPFFVVNSDAFWLNGPTDALGRLAARWDDAEMDALLLLFAAPNAYGYTGAGDFNCDPLGRLTRRPECEIVPWLFTGVQIIRPEVFDDTPEGPFSLNLIYDRLIEAERLFGVIHDGEWFHIGTTEGLAEAEAFLEVPFAETRHRST